MASRSFLATVALGLVIALLFATLPFTNYEGRVAGPPISGTFAPSDGAMESPLRALISNVSLVGHCSGPYYDTAYVFGNATGGSSPYRFTWSFGDGSPVEVEQNASHGYSILGRVNLTLWVTDAAAGNSSVERQLNIIPVPCPILVPTPAPALFPLALWVILGGAIVVAVVLFAILYGERRSARTDEPSPEERSGPPAK